MNKVINNYKGLIAAFGIKKIDLAGKALRFAMSNVEYNSPYEHEASEKRAWRDEKKKNGTWMK